MKIKGYAIAAMVLACLPASADTFYTSQAAWAAATSGVSTVNFEGLAPDSNFILVGSGAGANTTIGGVNFAVGPLSNGNAFILGKNFYYPGVSAFSSQESTTGTDDLLITLPSAVTAVGLDYGAVSTFAVTFTLSDGSTIAETAGGLATLSFLGETSSVGITSVDIKGADTLNGINMTDFSSGTAVPEPEAWVLLATILLCLGVVLRRRTRVSSQEV